MSYVIGRLDPPPLRRFSRGPAALLVALAAALTLAAASTATAEQPGAIAGRVRDAVTGRPVAGVEVRLVPWNDPPGIIASAVTGAGGRYRIGGVEPGVYHVYTATSAGYVGELSDGTPCYSGLGYRERFGGYLCDQGVVAPPVIAVRARETVDVPFALDLGGVVTGRVAAAETGEPVAAVTVSVSSRLGVVLDSAVSDATGVYRVRGLPTGRYRVSTFNQAGLADEVYEGIHCDGRLNLVGWCDPRPGTPVRVALRGKVTIDFALERLGAIAGRITDAASGAGLQGIDVTVERDDDRMSSSARTGADGGYLVGGLPAGRYRVATVDGGGWVDELYDDLPCAGGVCPRPEETLVAVEIDRVSEGVDFALDWGGAITGSVVSDVTGAPLAGMSVWYSNAGGVLLSAVRTDEAGRFRIGGLPAGSYLLHTAGGRDHGVADEAFDGVACGLAEQCGLGPATPVAVALGEETEVEFTLEPLGEIAGTVTAEATGEPIPGLELLFHDPRGGFQFTETDAAGRYRSPGLPRGAYAVVTEGSFLPNPEFIDELYDGVRCFVRECDPLAEGDLVPVASGETAGGVDFALRRGGAIEGRVTRESNGEPERFTHLAVIDSGGRLVRSALVDGGGRYRAAGLADGDYYVMTIAPTFGLVDEVYERQQCVHGSGLACVPTEGTPVRVAAGSPPAMVDFALAFGFRPGVPCRTTPTKLCLDGGRFRVGVRRSTFEEPGVALGRAISDSAGAFTFFAGDNLEAVVRVVDACTAFDRFWVLAAGLTGFDTDAGVLDTLTGEARFYFSIESAPALDAAAFDTCGAAAGGPAPLRVVAGEVSGGAVPAAAPAGGPGSCVPGPATLCLLGGRFAVEAEWADGAGGGGTAGAAPLGDRSGYLWFHRPGSPEIAVKALDACALPRPRFWIFASGLTDSDVVLTVTDTVSGESHEYTNPLGRPFEPIRDFATFDGCP